MKELYKLPARPEANRQNILQGDKYRITMLTEGLVRLEYSEDGIFEDSDTDCYQPRFPACGVSGEGDGGRAGNSDLEISPELQ